MTRSPRKLVRRVAWGGALSAAIGGLLASSVSGFTAHHWVERGEDRELLRVADELASELEEELAEDLEDDTPDERRHFAEVHGPRTLSNILIHELEDVRLRAPRAVVREGGRPIAGDPSLPDLRPGECLSVARPAPMRACASAFGQRHLVLAQSAEGEIDRRTTFLVSVLLGAVASALLGGIGGLFVATWALGPLDELRRRVRGVRSEQPRSEELGARSQYLEIEELREAIADLVERLASALDRAKAFASQAAHELRTPLSALSCEVELLLERQPEVSELVSVHEKLGGLSGLVERLLTLATPGANLKTLGRAVDLSDVLQDVLPELGAEASRVELRSMDDPIVRGDEHLLRTLLFNALDNALKFSRDASDDRVVVEIFARREWIVLQVRDHGIGMSELEKQKAFVAFYRSPRARALGVQGHGIGVALMHHVAQAHGGGLRYLSATSGTLLELELPIFR